MPDRFIDGIYNYCDRWCERCPLTSRCRVFAVEAEQFDDPESNDPQNAAFWTSLHSVFDQTKQMLIDIAQEHGISPEELEAAAAEDAADFEEERRRRRRNPLVRRGEAYAFRVNDWFDEHRDAFELREDLLDLQIRLGQDENDPEGEVVRITDALEVIRWYQFQIAVKLSRAVSQRDEASEEHPDWRRAALDDADGSAKVALLGIDRSLWAWTVLGRAFPELADDILDIQLRLTRLRRDVEEAFPEARAFHRPGVDDPEIMRQVE